MKLKSWIPEDEITGQLAEQVANVTKLDVLYKHLALMPDAHGGYGMPVGGVAALRGAISPYMVGVDIGCGMLATKLGILAKDVDWESVIHSVNDVVPMGKGGQHETLMPVNGFTRHWMSQSDVGAVLRQVGTLGSGNHFIEFDEDPDDGRMWIVIHSGSRRLGKLIADRHHEIAIEQCKELGIELPHKELAYLTEGTPEFNSYVIDMEDALSYAWSNRQSMMAAILDDLDWMGYDLGSINVHHNFASQEEYDGEYVWVHRKGATRAYPGEKLVVPMNMGDGIIIGTGLGNEDAFYSCSHGAGRAMSRGQAKKKLDKTAEYDYLAERGILISCKSDFLDEAPHAYKDSEIVMSRQSDLVRIDKWLKPKLVMKG